MINRKLTWLFINSLCVLTMAMAVVVMRGWWTQDSNIVQVRPDYAPMQFNTALCFLLAAAAIWLLFLQKTRLSISLTLAGLSIAVLSGLQYLVDSDFGIDTLFVDPFTTVRTSHAGRMAPNTALSFALINLGVLFALPVFRLRMKAIVGMSTAAFVFAIAVTALLGYGTGLDGAMIWGNFTRMALHTALGFIMLSVGLTFTVIHNSEVGNLYEIPLLPHISAATVLLFTLLLWLALQTTNSLHIQSLLNKHDEDLGGTLKTYLTMEGRALQRLGKRISTNIGNPEAVFNFDTHTYLEGFPDIIGLAWLRDEPDSNLFSYREQTRDTADLVPLFELDLDDTEQLEALEIDTVASHSGQVFLRLSIATSNQNQINGHLVTLVRLDILFAEILKVRGYTEYVSSLYLGDQLIAEEKDEADPRWHSTSALGFAKVPIDIVSRASPELIRQWHSYLPTVFLIVGVLLSFLVGTVLSLFQTTRRMTLALSESNQKLHNSLNDIRKAREELEEKSIALMSSNRDLENFASIAAHDLKEPLRKVSMFGERLLTHSEDQLDEKSRIYLETMINGASRMQALLESLLAYSRVTTHGQEFEPTDLNDVLKDVQSDLGELISESHAHIEIAELPTIKADAVQMRQLFQNLIANALRYRKPDLNPVIRVQVESAGSEDSGPVISVADNGIGFAQEHANEIFEVFKRLHTRANYPGTGMGLAVCKRIMERHKGHIRAEGVPDQGAKFILSFPPNT